MKQAATHLLNETGNFLTGCNYWASHAGIKMWSNWNPDQIEEDMITLKKSGITTLRIFPLWSDFQPISLLRGAYGTPVECRFGELALPDTDTGKAGMSEEMLQRFACFLELLDKHNMTCIVALITGWMSGRLFVPPALEGLNPITDPLAIRWETRFVKYLVTKFKSNSTISAWELGNECNCMGKATRDEAYEWTALIANTVKAVDPSRPIISGMHSLSPTGAWSMFDQAELTDILTTHPYPIFTKHCGNEPINTIRPILHSTAESRYYADLGGKACLCEELGILGNMIASEKIAAQYVRSCLFSLWANDCNGLIWWCSADQGQLEEAPYDWFAFERELGIIRDDKTAKPVADEFASFSSFLKSLPFEKLPLRSSRAVCILTKDQDNWGVAYASFILAKQAGFDIEFQYADQPLKDAELYLMPSIKDGWVMSKLRLETLYDKIRKGSTLYISHDNGIMSNFEQITGLEVQSRETRINPVSINMELDGEEDIFSFDATRKLNLKATRAKVIGTEPDGNPAFSVSAYGKGKVFFLGAPLEISLSLKPHAFTNTNTNETEYWHIYKHIGKDILDNNKIRKQNSALAVTEHIIDASSVAVVTINMSDKAVVDSLSLVPGWIFSKSIPSKHLPSPKEESIEINLKANDAVVYIINKLNQNIKKGKVL